MTKPLGPLGWDWLNSQGFGDPLAKKSDGAYAGYYKNTALGDYMVWNQLMTAPDAARKRMALALSEIFWFRFTDWKVSGKTIVLRTTGIRCAGMPLSTTAICWVPSP